jgi:hypothetical protein
MLTFGGQVSTAVGVDQVVLVLAGLALTHVDKLPEVVRVLRP